MVASRTSFDTQKDWTIFERIVRNDFHPLLHSTCCVFVHCCCSCCCSRDLLNCSICSMLIIFNPCRFANAKQSSRLAMSPFGSSALTSSHMIPAAGNPANLHKSFVSNPRRQLYCKKKKERERDRLTDRSFRVTSPVQDASRVRPQRHQVSRPVEIVGRRRLVGEFPRRQGAVVRRDARRRAVAVVARDRVRRLVQVLVLVDHHPQL